MRITLSLAVQFCLLLLAVGMTGCSQNETKAMFSDTDNSEFKVGQVWKYKTRPGEEASTFVILKVETAPGWRTIVHIGVSGLQFKTAKGIQDTLPHLPFDEAAVKQSVTTKVSDHGQPTNFQEGYEIWREDASSGKGAGVFSIPVAEAVAMVEEALNKAQAR